MATRARKDSRGRTRWQIVWYDSGGSEQYYTLPLGSTRREAEAKERAILRLRDDGVDWRPRQREAAKTSTVRGLMDGWVTYRRGVVRSTHTVDTEASGIKVFLYWLEEVVGARDPAPPEVLTKGLLHAHYAWLLAPVEQGGRQVGDAHAGRAINYVRRAWQWAHESGDHPGTPPAPSSIETRKPIRKRTVAPTWAHVDAIVTAVSDIEVVRRTVTIMRYTGLRVSQALRLTWEDVDLVEGWLDIRPELGKTAPERVGREIPMPAPMLAELATWGEREGHLVPREGRSQSAIYQQVQKRLADAWTSSGFPSSMWRGRTSHSFRKAVESGCKAARCDRDAIEYYVGHDLKVMGVYVDPDDLDLDEVARAIPAIGSCGKVESLRGRARRSRT